MICKTANIAHTKEALSYCEKGGDLLWANNCFGNSQDIFDDFSVLQEMNTRAEKKSIHAIISLNPKDRDLNTQELIDISRGYAEIQGFSENQYAVYYHVEKDHKHLHIVANRIGYDLKACSTSNNFYKNKDFASETENKFGLIPTIRKEKGSEKDFVKNNVRINNIKEILSICISSSSNLKDFCTKTEEYGLKALIGRGISFIDKDGATFKGSEIGREFSLKGIEKQLETNALNSTSEVKQVNKQVVPLDSQEKSVQLRSLSMDHLSENNGNMNSDIDEIVNSGKKKGMNM